MLVYALKIVVIFLVAVAAMRLMGKSTIVQLTPYDLVAIFIIGTIATEPLITTDIRRSLMGLAIVVGLYVFLSRLTLFETINHFLLGEPTILVKHGKIIKSNLKRNHISIMQLLSSLRVSGYPNLADVDYVLLEPIGALSVIPKHTARPLSPEDMGIKVKYEGMPISLVVDGNIQRKNLKLIHKDKEWLCHRLALEGVKDVKDILYASMDAQEKFYLNLQNDEVKEEQHQKLRVLSSEKKSAVHSSRLTVVPARKPLYQAARKRLDDEPEIHLIRDGMIQVHGLRKANLQKKSLITLLKKQGIRDMHLVKEAWLDSDKNFKFKT